jgi:hypothetical protein
MLSVFRGGMEAGMLWVKLWVALDIPASTLRVQA